MASDGEPGLGYDGPAHADVETLLAELDLARLRATDFSRYWPATRIALCLMADSAQPSLAEIAVTVVRLGDAVCSGEG